MKILAVLLITSSAAVLLSQYKKEYDVCLSVAAGCMVSLTVISKIYAPVSEIVALLKNYGMQNQYISAVLKAVAIGYISKFTADTCRDSGQTSLAAKAEFVGKAVIFMIALPVLLSTLKTVYGIIK